MVLSILYAYTQAPLIRRCNARRSWELSSFSRSSQVARLDKNGGFQERQIHFFPGVNTCLSNHLDFRLNKGKKKSLGRYPRDDDAQSPLTFLTINQDPFLSEPIRISIRRPFKAVVALEIVGRDTESICIICFSVIRSFLLIASNTSCCLLGSSERITVSFSASVSVSFSVSLPMILKNTG